MKKNWDVYQQWYCLLGQEGETAPGAFFCCACQLKRMLFLLSIQHSFFTRTLLCVSMCRAAEGEKKKKTCLRSAERETGFCQPKSDRLTDDHAWLLRSVSDPTRRECWSSEGQWSVRTERTGWRTSKASILFPADFNSHCNSGKSICLSVRGKMETRTVSLDWLSLWSATTEVKNFGRFCLFPLAPQSLEKIRFRLNWWGTFA